MGPFFLPTVIPVQDTTARTVERARTTLTDVDFERVDVREALRRLFRKGSFGGTVAPDVQGVITVSLRNVTWETALQNVTRQVDATYRVDHGFFEIVRREEAAPLESHPWLPIEDQRAIEASYRSLRYLTLTGQGPEVERRLAGVAVEDNLGRSMATGKTALERLIDAERGNPTRFLASFRPYFDAKREPNVDCLAVEVAYGPEARYQDLWRREGKGAWRLVRRRDASLRFVNAPVTDVVRALGESVGVAVAVDSRIKGLMTVDLTAMPFESALQRITRALKATYRIEGGVYEIVPQS